MEKINSVFMKINLLVCGLLASSTGLFAGPPPPPSGVPIDESVWIVFGIGIVAGIYKIRQKRNSKEH